ncbi:bifunctional lysylphosphatidylglycerol flippase/synthetase MprF [Lactobacillaceae bacterium 24-114]
MKKLYDRIMQWWNRYSQPIKIVFITSVVLFVIYALSNFFKTVDWHKVGIGLSNLSIADLVTLTIMGCIAIIPMLGYDFAIVKFLPGKFKRSYIIRCGWITNTLTNIAGFGGILGSSLRAYFYRKNASKSEILLAISKIAVFLLSGLSVLCWIALIIIFGFHHGGHFDQYAIWLVAGGLYFPIVFYFTLVNDNKLFNDVTPKIEALLVTSSTCEWLFVAVFFVLVGASLNVPNSLLLTVFPLYVVAQLLGVISMIPGALGSFDVIMMLELSFLGIPKSTIVIWLLLFRIFYYLVPLLLAGLMFINSIAQQVNDFFDGMPLMILQWTAHFLITVFMYVAGIFMLISATVPDITTGNRFMENLYPFTFVFIHQFSTVLFAIALLACARGVESKVQKAYLPTLILLVIGIATTWWNLKTATLTIYLAVVFFLILLSKKELYRKKLQYSISKLTTDLLIFAGSCIMYVVIGVINTPSYSRKHHVPNFFLFPGEKIWFSGLIGIIIGLIIVGMIVHYFCSGPDPFAKKEKFDAERTRKVIETFGGSRTSHLAFLRDKNLYFYQKDGKDQLYFMYRRNYDRLIVMGNPVGNKEVVRAALKQFLTEADKYDYQLVFYEVSGEFTMLLHEFGFDFIKTGETALVRLADFTLAGKRQRSQRALMHKFDREGYQFEIIQPPFDKDFLQKLKVVSDDWLGKQPEKGFSLGYFDPYYLQQAPIAIVKDKNDKIVAFATLMPTGGKKYLTIDLMRHAKDAPSGIMDKIFISLFLYGQENGYEYFDLGMAPLSNVGESQFSFLGEKIAHFIYEYGYHFYGFQGLRHYKNKYADVWQSRYTAFRKWSSIINSMIGLVSVISERPDKVEKSHPFFNWMSR